MSILNYLFYLVVFWTAERNLQIYKVWKVFGCLCWGKQMLKELKTLVCFIGWEITLILSKLKSATNRTTCHLNPSVCISSWLILCHLKPCDDRVNHSTVPFVYTMGFVTLHATFLLHFGLQSDFQKLFYCFFLYRSSLYHLFVNQVSFRNPQNNSNVPLGHMFSYNSMTRWLLAPSLAQWGMLLLHNCTHPGVCLIT